MSAPELESYAQIAIALGTLFLAIVTYRNVNLTRKLVTGSEKQAAIQHSALNLQNEMLLAQVTYQRLEMYWKTLAPITDAEIKLAELVPEDWMDPALYVKTYKGKPDDLRRYLWLARLYEFLAFTHKLKKLERADPLPADWTEQWTKDLVERREFREVDAYYGRFYKNYSELVREHIRARDSLESAP